MYLQTGNADKGECTYRQVTPIKENVLTDRLTPIKGNVLTDR